MCLYVFVCMFLYVLCVCGSVFYCMCLCMCINVYVCMYVRMYMCLIDGGRLYTWGWGENGRLGTGDTRPRLIPTLVRIQYLRVFG